MLIFIGFHQYVLQRFMIFLLLVLGNLLLFYLLGGGLFLVCSLVLVFIYETILH